MSVSPYPHKRWEKLVCAMLEIERPEHRVRPGNTQRRRERALAREEARAAREAFAQHRAEQHLPRLPPAQFRSQAARWSRSAEVEVEVEAEADAWAQALAQAPAPAPVLALLPLPVPLIPEWSCYQLPMPEWMPEEEEEM